MPHRGAAISPTEFRASPSAGGIVRVLDHLFNSFNHLNCSNPNAQIGSSSAGQVSSTQTARSMQFALKALFFEQLAPSAASVGSGTGRGTTHKGESAIRLVARDRADFDLAAKYVAGALNRQRALMIVAAASSRPWRGRTSTAGQRVRIGGRGRAYPPCAARAGLCRAMCLYSGTGKGLPGFSTISAYISERYGQSVRMEGGRG